MGVEDHAPQLSVGYMHDLLLEITMGKGEKVTSQGQT
jgi:hypothetical protein